jgi:apolipoprotein N-acyltransferase
VIWIGLLIRGSLGARSGWAVAAVTWFAFSLVWGLQLAWIRHVSVAGWWPLAIYSAAYAVTLVVVVRWAAGRLRRMPLSVLTGVFGVAFEYIRAEVLFDAWPFHLAGHSFWGSAVSGLASLGGVWACSLVAYSCGGLVAAAFLSARRRSLWSEAALPAGLALIVVATGWIPLTPAPGSQPLEMLAVQTNLPQDNKVGWRPERQAEDVRSFLQMTRDGLETHEGTDLVVWPETMVPGLGFESETLGLLESYGPQTEAWSRWPREVSSAAAGSGVPWIVGSLTWTGVEVRDGVLEPAKRFNSAVLLTPTGSSERGDKMFLTPFGETMPYVRAWPWLERLVMDFGASGMRFDLDASDVPARLTLEIPGEPSWLIGVPICFEDAVPSVVRDVCVQDGEVVVDAIVNISNDGWFGDRDAARRAHAIAAAFRAIELGRPLLRVANTGESALFLPDGSNPASLPPRVAGTLAASMPRFDHRTLYARLGNWLPRLCVFLGVLILGAGLLAARGGLSSSAR